MKANNHPFFAGVTNVPEVIAHRGGAGQWPGETIYAFEQALQIGVDVLEMDIRFTSDGVPILMHNRNVFHTTGTKGNVEEFESAEITEENAASWWTKGGKDFHGANVFVPTLAKVLNSFPGTRMIIEIKPFNVPLKRIQEFGQLLHNFGPDKVLVASGCHMNLRRFRHEFPEIATSASVGELSTFRVLKSAGYKPNCAAVQLSSKAGPIHFITRKYVDKAHSQGLMVHGWTVNKPEEMGRLIEARVDGIITDYPTTLLSMLNRV